MRRTTMDGRRPTDAEVIAMVAEFWTFRRLCPTSRDLARVLSSKWDPVHNLRAGDVSSRTVEAIAQRLCRQGHLTAVGAPGNHPRLRWGLPRPTSMGGAAR